MPPGCKFGSWLFCPEVVPFQPYLIHISYLVFGCGLVFDPQGLHPGHEFLGSLPCLFQPFQVGLDLRKGGRNIIPISTRVIAHQKVEGGLPHGFTLPAVVSKFHHRQIVDPIVLLVVDEELEVGFNPLVVLLQLSICPGVIHCGNVLCNSQYVTHLLGELGCEPRVSVTYNFAGESKASKHLGYEQGHGSFCCDGFIARDEKGGLGAIVISNH